MSGKSKKNKCLLCKQPASNVGWVYEWQQKQGYACDPCGRRFHDIGDYLMEKATDFCNKEGIKHIGWKEKYGTWRFSTYPNTVEQVMKLKALHSLYAHLFPDFTWDWDID